MFNFLNIFAKYNYVLFNNKLFQINTKKFCSSHSLNVSSITPIRSYFNADLEKVTIIKQNKGKSGIYRWVNLINTIKFTSKSKAAKFLGVSETTVRNVIKLNKSCKSYTIMIG